MIHVIESEIDGHRVKTGECAKHGRIFAEVFHPFEPRLAEFVKQGGTWAGECSDCKRERDALARDEAEADREIDSRQDEIRAWVMAQMDTPAVRAKRKKAIAARMAERMAEHEQNIRLSVEAEINETIFARLALEREDAIRAERLAKKEAQP